MDLFGQLLEIKTWTEKLAVKTITLKWTDFEYLYDIKNDGIYINWLDKNEININTLQQVINNIFFIHNPKKETTSFLGNLMNNQNKKPKVFYFTYSNNKEFVCINKIKLETKRNSNLEILELKISSINYNS